MPVPPMELWKMIFPTLGRVWLEEFCGAWKILKNRFFQSISGDTPRLDIGDHLHLHPACWNPSCLLLSSNVWGINCEGDVVKMCCDMTWLNKNEHSMTHLSMNLNKASNKKQAFDQTNAMCIYIYIYMHIPVTYNIYIYNYHSTFVYIFLFYTKSPWSTKHVYACPIFQWPREICLKWSSPRLLPAWKMEMLLLAIQKWPTKNISNDP